MIGRPRLLAIALCAAGALAASASAASASPFLQRFSSTKLIASAVPPNGDQNPYGVAVVKGTTGDLVRGDVLVSDFNNSANQQGTGSAIMEISPSGTAKVFAVIPPPTATPATGLTTALVALRSGFVIVGSLPAPGGQSSAMTAGALTILNSDGQVVDNYTAPDINGPWDMTALDHGSTAWLFVTNVLNGTVAAAGKTVKDGTVVRLELNIPAQGTPAVLANSVIATGFPERTDPNALVVGPTGVGLASDGTLYVADADHNRIAAIPRAVTRMSAVANGGTTVSFAGNLNDPLGLAIAPSGNILSTNGGDGRIVETRPGGRQVDVKTLVPEGAGDLFGLALAPLESGIYFVNDAGSGPDANSLELLH
jgi:hypothetical protein